MELKDHWVSFWLKEIASWNMECMEDMARTFQADIIWLKDVALWNVMEVTADMYQQSKDWIKDVVL